jgi:pre-mRNA-processing factor 17
MDDKNSNNGKSGAEMDLTKQQENTLNEEESIEVQAVAKRLDRRLVNPAPSLAGLPKTSSTILALHHGGIGASAATTGKRKGGELVLMNNPTKAVLYQPVQGPQGLDPSRPSSLQPGTLQSNIAFDESTFAEQRTAFQRTGQALAPNEHGSVVVRTTLGYDTKRLALFTKKDNDRRKRPRPDPSEKPDPLVYGSDDEAVYGVWAPPSKEERWAADNSLSQIASGGVESLAPEQRAEREYITERNRQRGEEEEKEKESDFDRLLERKMSHLLPPRADDAPMDPTTTFHGPTDFDYKGRTWIAPPAGTGGVEASDLTMDHHRCYVPKKCIHRFTGHTQGVHRIRLFPVTGHLLLSAGLDGKCKVWSIEQKQVMRTYVGHSAAVRDAQFNHDGTKFVSASFDRYLRLWKTESGEVLQTFTNKKVPYVVQFYPRDDNFFVAGCSDNKIVAYNATTAEITQEYNHHLAPVNAILFVEDQGTKMVSSGDDKKVLIWEWDIGVPIKYISDPSMHSMPSLTMHPSGQFFCAQSLDNTICVFQAGGRFALQRKKKFSGHQVAGYACETTISPDGQFLVSGDGNGKLFIWDWKRHK